MAKQNQAAVSSPGTHVSGMCASVISQSAEMPRMTKSMPQKQMAPSNIARRIRISLKVDGVRIFAAT